MSSINYLFISSLEIDHILNEGSCFRIISSKVDLPVDGMVTGIKTRIRFSPYDYPFLTYTCFNNPFSRCTSSELSFVSGGAYSPDSSPSYELE